MYALWYCVGGGDDDWCMRCGIVWVVVTMIRVCVVVLCGDYVGCDNTIRTHGD